MKYLKELRKAAEFNQEEIASVLGISRSHLAGIEQGTYRHGRTDDQWLRTYLDFLRFHCVVNIQEYKTTDERKTNTAKIIRRLMDLERVDVAKLLNERVIILALDSEMSEFFPRVIPRTFEALSALRLYQYLIGRIDIILLSDYDDLEKLVKECKWL
jgi:transcriptional regulator with XRE-family HTH domain